MIQNLSVEVLAAKIFMVRGNRVILDNALAGLYGVPTKVLIQGVRRNIRRFPEDFMFQLTWEEAKFLRSQFVTLNSKATHDEAGSKRGRHIKYRPYAFTEHGVLMLSCVLKSERAVRVNIAVVRAFVRLREILLTNTELAAKIEALELKYKSHDMKLSEYGKHIAAIFEAIKQLMAPPPVPEKPKIGFHT